LPIIAYIIILLLINKAIWYPISLHVRSLLYAWTEVFLFYGEHLLDGYYLSSFEELVYLFLVGQVLVLKMDVVPDVIRSEGVIFLLILDPSIVLEGIIEKLLELTSVFYHLGF